MDDEISVYAGSIRHRFARIADAVAGLTSAQLNARPPVGGGNSAWVLATHTAGNARAWILGIACGIDVGRDRPAEFASRGDDGATLAAELARCADEVTAALAALDPARLSVRLLPAQALWGESTPREISVRDAIVQVIEHASLHLGHLQLTRDFILATR